MGWKALKDYFRIPHIVHVNPMGDICIGTIRDHDLVIIGKDGQLKKRSSFGYVSDIQDRLEANPKTVLQLLAKKDVFEADIPVFTFDRHQIIEKRCEQPGWPNVTHDGDLMCAMRFSTDKATVVAWAKAEAKEALSQARRTLKDAKLGLEIAQTDVVLQSTIAAVLKRDYPTANVAAETCQTDERNSDIAPSC